MLDESSQSDEQIYEKIDPPEGHISRKRRLDPLFDFLHATLDRIQDGSELLLSGVRYLVKTWMFKFTSGLVAGLLFVSLLIWIVKATIGTFMGESSP